MEEQNIKIAKRASGFLTLITSDCFMKDVILTIKGEETSVRDKYTIQVSPNIHISPNKDSGKYINHSCFPNTKVNEERQFIALSDIKKGEEITFDYNSTEDELAEQFYCNCGHKNCRGKIQ